MVLRKKGVLKADDLVPLQMWVIIAIVEILLCTETCK